ncbi:hypothetical protein ABIB25_002317 [Nakamurella sp. UYEF19]|uniref:hypothetical protein n=1 Tax=Nakamurella sp. UYEF19 TaxID=1756392 RepID=UPI003398C4FF
MNRTEERFASVSVLRLLLLTGVVAGILAMHVLGGHESMNGSSPMAMATPVAAPFTASDHTHSTSAGAVMPSMSSRPVPSARSVDVEPVSVTSMRASPVDMTHMTTCCLLYLTAVGLVLLAALAVARLRDTILGLSERSMMTCPVRGPPGLGPPRISLCVLRV